MKKNKTQNNSGFSILEVSIVLGVISIGLLGVFSLVMQNIQVQRTSKNMLVASMLAQEGLELTRNLRDTNWVLDSENWDENIYDNEHFIIDYTGSMTSIIDSTPNDITDNIGAKLYLTSQKFYTHDSGGNTATQYYRLITVISGDKNGDGDIDNYQIKSHVQWKEKQGLKNYIAITELYDWR